VAGLWNPTLGQTKGGHPAGINLGLLGYGHKDRASPDFVPKVVFSQMKGFLGTGATFGADLNLIVQLIMGVALVAGVVLAKGRRYRAHGICQSTVLLLNLIMIALVMGPSFRLQVTPALPRGLHKHYYAAAAVHGFFGIAAELLGLYIVLVAGTNVVPQSLRFKNWKPWMRVEFILWAFVLLTGLATYCAWYIAPLR
jgi:uncharacterized membrane protein YozB (DUF420 family)